MATTAMDHRKTAVAIVNLMMDGTSLEICGGVCTWVCKVGSKFSRGQLEGRGEVEGNWKPLPGVGNQ